MPCSFLLPKADAKKAEQVAETERRANQRLDPGVLELMGMMESRRCFKLPSFSNNFIGQYVTDVCDIRLVNFTRYVRKQYRVYCCVEKRKSGHSY